MPQHTLSLDETQDREEHPSAADLLHQGLPNASRETFLLRLGRLVGLIALLALFCVGVQSGARCLGWPLDLTANKGAGQILLYLFVLGSIVLFKRLAWADAREPSRRQYLAHGRRAAKGFALGAGLTLAAQFVLYGILAACGAARWSLRPLTGPIITQTAIALLIVIVLATTEETIFRGFVFNYLRPNRRRTTTLGAVTASAVVFALAHNFHTPAAWFAGKGLSLFIGLTLLGTLLAVAYLAARSLTFGIGVHAALVWLDVFRRRTDLIVIHQSHWGMGTDNDLRTAPIVWAMFACLALGIWAARHALRRRVQIERLPS